MKNNNFFQSLNNSKGFTMAEVLLVIGIIGIVAAYTIPTLVNNTNDAELKTKFKKDFSVLNQANMSIINENGGSLKNLCNTDDHNCLRDLFLPYLNLAKVCDTNASNGNCWHKDGVVKAYAGIITPSVQTWRNNSAAVILNDGTLIKFAMANTACDWNDSGNGNYVCGWIDLDVNGFKPPNVQGKDILSLYVKHNAITPLGGINSYYKPETSCTTTDTTATSGIGCAAKYLMD